MPGSGGVGFGGRLTWSSLTGWSHLNPCWESAEGIEKRGVGMCGLSAHRGLWRSLLATAVGNGFCQNQRQYVLAAG